MRNIEMPISVNTGGRAEVILTQLLERGGGGGGCGSPRKTPADSRQFTKICAFVEATKQALSDMKLAQGVGHGPLRIGGLRWSQ